MTANLTRNNRRFFLLGLGLAAVFLVCLGIYLASELTWRKACADYYGQFPQSFAWRDRLHELWWWRTSRVYWGIYSLMIASGLGSFLWLLTLIGRGILWWVKRRG